jgi:hypothetical protein
MFGLLASWNSPVEDRKILCIGIKEPTTASVVGPALSKATISIRLYLTRRGQVTHPPGTPEDPRSTMAFGSSAFTSKPSHAPRQLPLEVFVIMSEPSMVLRGSTGLTPVGPFYLLDAPALSIHRRTALRGIRMFRPNFM